MQDNDIVNISKIVMINMTAFLISIQEEILSGLQIMLLILTIGYTCYKWFQDHKKNKK